MNLIQLENVSKSYTAEHPLFCRASFSLDEGEKIGVIGINGSGKSTLLKMIAGMEEPDEGSVSRANHLVIRYLPQNPVFDGEMTVLEGVLHENQTPENAWSIESDAKSILNKLGFLDFSVRVGVLSGGQRKRLALARAILTPADVLILDEPTNHLDNDMSEWLEAFLRKWRGALVMVTHDRYFLDSVSNCIVEIDDARIYRYPTNYEGFLERKAQREEMEAASERKRQSLLRGELEWIRRGARARTTKQKARIQRYEALREEHGPSAQTSVEMSSVYTRMGRTTVELEHVSKCYDRPIVTDFSYIFLQNDRVGFIGPNGCGKSTLLNIIVGREQPDSGEVRLGQTIRVGYYAQEIRDGFNAHDALNVRFAVMDPEKRVIDEIRDTAEYVRTSEGLVSASQMLERFLFPPAKQYTPIGKLSGGERRRLNLLRVLMEAPNVLVLDEPTNDLDIPTLTILEDYLDHFEGIVIIVSHDRYFLDRTVRRIFAFEEEGHLRQYEGGWTEYFEKVQQRRKEEEAQGTQGKRQKSSPRANAADDRPERIRPKKLRFSYLEQKEYDSIEGEIAGLEESIRKLEQLIEESSTDFVRLNTVLEEKEKTEQQLEEKMERWMYLENLAERIKGNP